MGTGVRPLECNGDFVSIDWVSVAFQTNPRSPELVTRLFVSFYVLLLSTLAIPQSVTVQTSSPNNEIITTEEQAIVVRQSNLEKAIWNGTLNSPGVKLSLKEVSRSRAADRTLVKYQLYATGFPKHLRYALAEIKISGKFVPSL